MKLLKRNFHLLSPSSTHSKHPHQLLKLSSTPAHQHKGPDTSAGRCNVVKSVAVLDLSNRWSTLSPSQFSCSQETENCSMAANSHCFAGANTHLVVSDCQKTWGSAAQTSTFSMIAKSLQRNRFSFSKRLLKKLSLEKRERWVTAVFLLLHRSLDIG